MIELSGVSVVFNQSIIALDEVSLRFEPGTVTVLLGSSGAGKSTLLRCINWLTRPCTGSVHVDGIGRLDDNRRLREHRRRTGMIFQMHQLIGRHSALANVQMGRLGYRSAFGSLLPLPRRQLELALRCLERVGLLDQALQRADTLSGGQRQRVGIARALCQQPCIMLADEPVASLDPAIAVSVLDLIKRVCAEDGLTTVVSLHQVAFARQFAERIVGLAHGRVVFDGKPADLTDEHLHRIYHSSLAAASVAEEIPRALPSYRSYDHEPEPCVPQR